MSAVPKTINPSLRERVSKEEWQSRVDLAAAYQLAHIYKWTDLIYTHFSARVPGTEDFLINPYGMMFDEITASNLVKIDGEGKILDDPRIERVLKVKVRKVKPAVSAAAIAVMSAPLAATAGAAVIHGMYFCEWASRCFVGLIPY